jgi:glycosyltransferase involved in cell wall biosynthesis
MPVKDGEHFIPESIIGITKNIEKFDEVIVIDDNSSDSTRILLRDWAKSDLRVRVLSNPSEGIVSALNLGVREASNQWIARFDVDDKYESDRLTSQRVKIDKNISAIFCDYDFWSEEKENLGLIPSAVTPAATSISLVSGQRTAHPSAIFHRERVIEAGGYREEDFPAEDLSLWLRLSRTGSLVTIPRTLVHYRISRSSVTLQRQAESRIKKQLLLNQIGINPIDAHLAFESVSEIVSEYKSLDFYNERTALYFRDLFAVSKMNGKTTSHARFLSTILKSGYLGIGFLPAIIKLNKAKEARALARKLLSS